MWTAIVNWTDASGHTRRYRRTFPTREDAEAWAERTTTVGLWVQDAGSPSHEEMVLVAPHRVQSVQIFTGGD